MEIDLNNPKQFTRENVKRLIASGNDTTHTQLRVSKEGIAYMSDIVGDEEIEDLSFRLETWSPGAGCVGEAAASDDEWLDRIYDCLKANWPDPKSTHIDNY